MPNTLDIDGVSIKSDEDLKKGQLKDGRKLTRHGHEIPRPKNCFLSYRKEVSSKLIEYGIDNNSRNISKLVANLWRNESEDVRQHFRDIAEQEKLKHQKLYPDYKFMPRRKLPAELRELLAPSTTEYTTTNPPRKIARRSLPSVSDRVEPVKIARTKRKYKRSKAKKRLKSQENDLKKKAGKKFIEKCTSLKPVSMNTAEPLYEKFIKATIYGDPTLLEKEHARKQGPDVSLTDMDQQDFISSMLDYRPGCVDDLGCDYLNERSPRTKVESEHFQEQAAMPLDSGLFVNYEEPANDGSANERAAIDLSSAPEMESILYLPSGSVYTEKSLYLLDPVDGIETKLPDDLLDTCLMELDEEQNTVDPSSLTPSLTAASQTSEASDDLIEKHLDKKLTVPLLQELLKILQDEQGLQDFFRRLSSKEAAPMMPEVSSRIHELALCLPPVWSTGWYETDLLHNHTHDNTIPNCDIKLEHDSTISLHEFIDVDHHI